MNRSHIVCVRLSDLELAAVDKCAKSLGISKSELCRLGLAILNDVVESESNSSDVCINDIHKVVVVDLNTIGLVRSELNKIGVNLNQAVRAINTIAKTIKEDSSEIPQEEARALVGFANEAEHGLNRFSTDFTRVRKVINRISRTAQVSGPKRVSIDGVSA